MESTNTYFDDFRDLDKADPGDWNSAVISFMASVTDPGLGEKFKEKYRSIFNDSIDNENWDLLTEGLQRPSDILGDAGLEKMVKDGAFFFSVLSDARSSAAEFIRGKETDVTLASLITSYNIPGTSESIREQLAEYFVDQLGMIPEMKEKIIPVELFGKDIDNPKSVEDVTEDVKELIQCNTVGEVEALAKRKNFSADKLIRLKKLGNATKKAVAALNPADKVVASIPLLRASDVYEIDMSMTFGDPKYDNEIILKDTGIKSLVMAILIVFPGLVNDLLLNKDFHITMNTQHGAIDGLAVSQLKALYEQVSKLNMIDGDDVVDSLTSLFLAASYKLLAKYQNSLFSDKAFSEARFFMIGMRLLFFGVSVTVDGHILGDEANLYPDVIKLRNDKIIIKRRVFKRVKPGIFNEFYKINKTTSGRFYHYYNYEGKWGLGSQFWEVDFWENIVNNKIKTKDCGQKLLSNFLK